jgi:transposase
MTNRTYKSGTCRDQESFFPPRLEDYVRRDNPVRAIEAYVMGLDLAGLGFRHSEGGVGAGQPAYDPGDLLKLYLYGYLNRVRSSRRLECEAGRNVEVMWLLKGLAPGYRTISNFRKDNVDALKAANRAFVLLLKALDLVGGELVAIDGAFFHGDASKGSIVTKTRLEEQVAAVEREIEAYSATLEVNDATEDQMPTPAAPSGEDIGEKVAALAKEQARMKAALARLEESGETQLSSTDPDARLLSKKGQVVAGYNVQIAVDDRHKLIVASNVVNDGNDSGQLHEMAVAAKEALEVKTLQAVGDGGYYNGDTLRACEADDIVAYVPEANKNKRLEKQGRFTSKDFAYDAQADVYHCPAGAELRPMEGYKEDVGGKLHVRYAALQSVCGVCPLRSRCLTDKARRREVYRWQHHDVIDRHRARMAGADAAIMMRRRAALVEHPFGTLKCRAGYRHFLLRGFHKVRGEWSLMALCYNFSRVLSILGMDRFLAYLAKNCPIGLNLLFAALVHLAIALQISVTPTPVHRARAIATTRPALANAA